ncbi:hypothetical protein BCR33DRAFT_583599 [Rhizoclosmatium globosum]|uniref:Uncharacterized protein n=1 Tax=Rhizoclosmatium globosum TaxID=329046 RepID=A0A1Y2CR15_9FUNG|nr:hypothetical protein BCR33DRAFT_583599 [Rhizoclosmatium globosum]|eukprot:ORY49489.1 hypothetical protein BCR33DRAFT_583599 [Rhizoclosmatium globosum]
MMEEGMDQAWIMYGLGGVLFAKHFPSHHLLNPSRINPIIITILFTSYIHRQSAPMVIHTHKPPNKKRISPLPSPSQPPLPHSQIIQNPPRPILHIQTRTTHIPTRTSSPTRIPILLQQILQSPQPLMIPFNTAMQIKPKTHKHILFNRSNKPKPLSRIHRTHNHFLFLPAYILTPLP